MWSHEKYLDPQRQSKVAIGIILIRFIRMTIKAFWPILLSFFITGKNSSTFETYLGYFIAFFALINLFGSILTFFRFFFHIEENAIVIDKGLVQRSNTKIPFERIQTINFQQNILHRLFNVVSFEIDTAGAKKSEIRIDALPTAEAEALRDYILQEKAQLAPQESQLSKTEEASETLLKLDIKDLIKIGVSQNHLKSMGLLFAFVFSTLNEITDDIAGLVESQLSGYELFLANNKWALAIISFVLVAIISFLYSLVSTVFLNYKLRLQLNKSGLKLQKGLFNRQEININKKKVQIISWTDNPIRMLFRMFTIKISQASSIEAAQVTSKLRIPGSYWIHIEKIISSIFEKEDILSAEKITVSKTLKWRLFVFLGVLPGLILVALFPFIQAYALIGPAWMAFILVMSSIYYRKRSLQINGELLKNNRGTFGHVFELIPIYKIQAVKVKQSWYQRRKQLANFVVYTAAGSIQVPFIPYKMALELESFVLYKIESDSREWM